MVTAVRAQPDEPMVSTRSLPSAWRDQGCARWLRVGTGGPASAQSPPTDHAARASTPAATGRCDPLITAPSYGRGCSLSSAGAVCFGLLPAGDRSGPAKQAGQVTLEAGEGEPGIQHVIGRDRPAEIVDRLIANLDRRRLGFGFGGDRNRDHPRVLAVSAGDFDQGLLIGMGDHLELAIGQAFPTFGALKSAGLATQNIEEIHSFFV